jgi:uncharacterized protein (DUF1330 family)
MAAYIIVQVGVRDKEKFETYRHQVPATLKKFGGEFIVRGGALEVLEGAWAHPRCVVIRFPDMKSAKTWHASPEYAGPKALREASADANMIVVDGV